VTERLLRRLFKSLTGVLLGFAAVLLFLRLGGTPDPSYDAGYFLQDPLAAPPFSLTAHTGERVTSTGFTQKHLIVFFGYTYCPDVCPLTLSNLGRAFRKMGTDAARFQVLLVSVDPGRDTQQRLGEYLTNFDASFLGLTGPEEEIRAIAQSFGVYFARVGEGEDYTVDHTARVFVVSPAGEIPLTFPVTATAEEMARDLAILLEKGS
jgi:protein SCO1/2